MTIINFINPHFSHKNKNRHLCDFIWSPLLNYDTGNILHQHTWSEEPGDGNFLCLISLAGQSGCICVSHTLLFPNLNI